MIQGRIVGGSDASRGSWRWITVFGKIGCSGSVIHPNFVLTAGHCCSPSLSRRKLTFWIKDYNLNDFNSIAERLIPDEIIRHPAYAEQGAFSIRNDLCLIYLSRVIEFDQNVQPVCLPTAKSEVEAGKTCYVAGWGLRQEDNFSSIASILQDAPVPILRKDLKLCENQN